VKQGFAALKEKRLTPLNVLKFLKLKASTHLQKYSNSTENLRISNQDWR